ncbi:MAG: AAA family ATPase [Geopsychrobacter sp.]|nr:AAA family ATPase [Geopsychrobacter sp.]
MNSNLFEVTYGIGFDSRTWDIDVNEKKVLEMLLSKHKLDAAERSILKNINTTQRAAEILSDHDSPSEKHQSLLSEISAFRESRATLAVIDLLNSQSPKFFYASHFERMSGEISLDKLAQDKARDDLEIGDQIFLDFLEYAGTSIEDLQQVGKYEELKAQCEGASNDISDEIFEFWSQNEALAVKIDIGEGKPDDPPPFNTGTIAKIRVENQHHRATVPLSERSAGFVWFFSFLAQFKQLKNTTGNAIILLDEPGLTLHGKAQSDLLRYIQERLLPEHQVIYTTHSPFMVPEQRLADVRVVEDVIRKDERNKPIVIGTKVSSDILSVDKDTLFPLQAHLGYEITQSLFIGKNTLLVEGPSDVLYLQAFSQALKELKREGLDPRWAICPTGGIDKIWSFASLFGGNKLNVAVLSDFAKGDKPKIERIKQSQLLKTDQVWTVSDFTQKGESDIEDLLHPEMFARLVNKTYSLKSTLKLSAKKLSEVTPRSERNVKNAETLFMVMPPEVDEFDHFSPSSWLIRNPDFIDNENEYVSDTLDAFEQVFKTYNALLKNI